MPADLRRRDEIAAAVDAYNRDHPDDRLPRPAARLLGVMFAAEDVCQQSLEALGAEGSSSGTISPGRYAPSSRRA